MKMIRYALHALFAAHYVVDNTPDGGPAPEQQDPQPKVIPTLPPADPTLNAVEAHTGTGTDPEAHTTIAGLDADGQPVTVEHVLDKQKELNEQTGAGQEPNPVLNPYIGKDPQSTTVPEVNPDIAPETDPTRTDVSGPDGPKPPATPDPTVVDPTHPNAGGSGAT